MEIKLNKELQKKLDVFLETKDAKMQECAEIGRASCRERV